jgi:hypothetical protein
LIERPHEKAIAVHELAPNLAFCRPLSQVLELVDVALASVQDGLAIASFAYFLWPGGGICRESLASGV